MANHTDVTALPGVRQIQALYGFVEDISEKLAEVTRSLGIQHEARPSTENDRTFKNKTIAVRAAAKGNRIRWRKLSGEERSLEVQYMQVFRAQNGLSTRQKNAVKAIRSRHGIRRAMVAARRMQRENK